MMPLTVLPSLRLRVRRLPVPFPLLEVRRLMLPLLLAQQLVLPPLRLEVLPRRRVLLPLLVPHVR